MIKTSAMFSAHTIHVLHVVLRDTLIFLLVLFFALFGWLLYGIQTDKLVFGQYEIDGLYIKLDKKLTLTANKIIIPETKAKPSFDNIDRTFDRIKYLFSYFEYIDLRDIHFKNNTFNFLFSDNVLYINSDDYEIAGNIERKGKKLIADISLFYIKKEKINITGKLKYFLNKDRLETEGAFEAYNISGNFAAFKENDDISFAVKSDIFTDLQTLTAKLPIKEVIKPWISGRVEAKQYQLDSFVGKASIVDKKLKVDVESLRGDATLNEVKIYFKDGLPPVNAKKVKLRFENRALYFDLENPSYKNRDLNGSKVSITNMKKGKIALLHLDLKVKSQLDATVQKILKAYKLKIPVLEKGEELRGDIKLIIPLKKKYKSAKEKAKHKVEVDIDLMLSKGLLTINKNIKLPVLRGKVHYSRGVVTLRNIVLKESWYAGVVNGTIKLKKKIADLKVNVDRLAFGSKKEKFFVLKNKNLVMKINYEKHTIEIPTLNAKLLRKDKIYTIELSNLNTIKPYIHIDDIEMDGGSMEIVTKDFVTYSFNGILKRNACFFYDKKNVCHTRIPCKGKVSKGQFILHAFDNRLNINIAKAMIRVNNLNIDLKAFFDSRKNVKSTSKSKKSKDLTILGKNSQLRYKEYTLVTDNYKIVGNINGNINAVGTLKKDKVRFIKKGKKVHIEAIKIKDALLHPLINFKGLKGGRYTFKAHGDPDKVMHGEVIIEGGVMRDFKAYNNTLAFINTLPALATLSKPGYSKKGFTIKHGLAKYRKIGDRIIFDMIHIEGTSADIVGKGEINLKFNTIKMNLAIQTAREFGKVVGSVPLLGYILMGKDKSMTVGLSITGSLSKPVVKTSATKEMLKLPLDIIKRTLQSPAHILNQEKKPEKKVTPKVKKPNIFNRVAP